ncbi:MAG TPA: glycosyltransferase family 4 protein [Polyangia bacterium]|jgi:glycosyltransferase involved in cell wall biosynthesis
MTARSHTGRLVFFLQGERVPAARVRGQAIIGALAAAGLPCEARVPYPSVYGDTRLPWPLNRARPLYVPWSFIKRFRELGDLRADDVVVFQRPMTELPTLALEKRAALERPSVFDFDDAIFLTRTSARKFRALVPRVTAVIAGNAFLAEEARRVGARGEIVVIPTVVDLNRFRAEPPSDRRGRQVVVGWTGSAVGFQYLLSIAPGIERALRRTGARFRIIADRPPPHALTRIGAEFVRWNPVTEIEDLAAIDVGLMPLLDGPQERGKCAFKLIQYMALGRVGVASPVGANREVVTDKVDGFFAASDDAWEEVLVRLINEPEARREVGARARQRIVSAYSIDAVLPTYLDLFGGLLGDRAAQRAGQKKVALQPLM